MVLVADKAHPAISEEEQLAKYIRDENIQFYPFLDFTETACNLYGSGNKSVYRTRVKLSDEVVTYTPHELTDYESEDALFKDFVEEVSNKLKI